jgi:hypothetical protein
LTNPSKAVNGKWRNAWLMQTQNSTACPQRTSTRFSPPEVLKICKRFVYPPCKKLSGGIRIHDKLADDLGYFGSSAGILALKTNQYFEFDADDRFSSLDIAVMTTVQDHVFSICKRLHNERRLVDDEFNCFGIR